MAENDQAAGRALAVVAYDAAWPQIAAAERDAIARCAGDALVAIEHIGSTSIPGLAAKPVIDIMAAVVTLDDGRRAAELLQALGYALVPTDMPRRLFLRRGEPGAAHRFHLHIVEEATWPERNERLLRDYLRAHPDEAAAYGALKQELAVAYANDPDGYTRAKTAFIQGVVDRARDALGLPRVDVWEE